MKPINMDAPFQTIDHTSYLTGESRDAIRKGIKAGRIPHIVRGSGNRFTYLVNLPKYMEMLNSESMSNVGEARS
ncbi:MAG: hypothetical protein II458_08190 [Oscillospiraceae bacterium]|nr:hypothetical protein [Oscillospiraceae bacterium]